MTKTFIIHTTEKAEQLRECLFRSEEFKKHYDGWEMTVFTGSTRYYFYKVPHADLTLMVRHLQEVKRELDLAVRVKIFATGHGCNFNFD
jgi:hypothetical protein